ncbi:MAG: MOSC domain-containing protein, partial [Planctomycetaceae bacterium]
LEIDGVEAFWEDRLYGDEGEAVRFRIGEVTFEGVNPCARCVVPARESTTGESDPDFAAAFIRQRAASLPPWAARSRFDHFYRLAVNTRLSPVNAGNVVRVGDEVEII